MADPTAVMTVKTNIILPDSFMVAPEFVEVQPGASVNFIASGICAQTGVVGWSVQEAGGGAINAATGAYSAPVTPGVYHVLAICTSAISRVAMATVVVGGAMDVSVSITPAEIQLNKGGTTNFSAIVEGAANNSVNWTCTGGTIDASGNYTAPTTLGTYQVTAASVADPSAYAVATVLVSAMAGTDKTFTYDANGNMLSDGERSFEWDAENRLVSVTIAATSHRSEFAYDGLGRRVMIRELDPDATQTLQVTSDKKYLWNGVEIAEERSSDGAVVQKRFYSQGFLEADGTQLYYTRDHLGSIRELTDSSQTVRARYEYDPYGRMTKVSGDKDSLFTYTGHFWHGPSGLNQTLYRAYDPNLGRWLSRDPITDPLVFSHNSEGQKSGNYLKVPDLINLDHLNDYSYVNNSSIVGFDPLGLKCVKIGAEIVRYDYHRWKERKEITWMTDLLGGKYLGPIGKIFSFGCKLFNVADMESFVAKIKTSYWCDGQCGDPLGLKLEFGPPDMIVRPVSSYLEVQCSGGNPKEPPTL